MDEAILKELQTLHRIVNIQSKWITTLTEHYHSITNNLQVIANSATNVEQQIEQYQTKLKAEISTLPDRRPTEGGTG